jgi:ATP-dependent DNA ligase
VSAGWTAPAAGPTFKRWRPDKRPSDCRYDQLEETAPYLIAQIFGTN